MHCMMRGNITNLKSIINILVNGTASWQLYYIVVLFQLVLVTPILFYLQEKNITFYNMLYIVTPLWMLIKYYVRLDFLYESQFPRCIEYLAFYLLGLQLGAKKCSLRIPAQQSLRVLLFMLLMLSFLEGKLWLLSGNTTMAMTQGKFSSYAYALCFIFYLVSKCKGENVRTYSIYSNAICKKILNMLPTTGNYSYGIFYIHCLILFCCDRLWSSIVGRPEISGIIYCFVIFSAVYIISFVLVYGGREIFGKKYAKIIGLI